MATELQCYHKGCGKKYKPDENSNQSCQFHPGEPVFHDAMKSWSCCNKKSTDFSVFLSIPGCTHDYHSNEKPPPVEPKAEKHVPQTQEIIVKAPLPPKPRAERPSTDTEMINLSLTVGESLKHALEKRLTSMTLESASQATELDKMNLDDITIGTICKNTGCGQSYQGLASLKELCWYHTGVAVFHEGMKYWSCCAIKTSDFSRFLEQKGCSQSLHKWVTKNDEGLATSCKVDWHQTGNFVIISVFAKCCDPIKTVIKANPVAVDIRIVFEDGKLFTDSVELYGVIDVKRSGVKLLGTKVEISLRKDELTHWSQLRYKPFKPAEPETTTANGSSV